MMRRDITPQWKNIADWYWGIYEPRLAALQKPLSIWELLERDYGVQRTRSMSGPSWTMVDFPDEKAYTLFLLRWS